MKLNFRNTKGITLVALIITIIVLLILAIVSIRLVINDGIIGKAEKGTKDYIEAEEKEQIQLGYMEYQMARLSGEGAPALKVDGASNVTPKAGGGWTVTFPSGRVYDLSADGIIGGEGSGSGGSYVANLPSAIPGTTTTENSKYTSDNKIAVIPAGYTVSNVATEQRIDNGLVISRDGNEWVWIPVENVTDLYTENTTNDEWILCGTSGENKVVSSYASKSEILSGLSRTTPGKEKDSPYFREPDTVVGNGTQYDNVEANWTAARFNSFKDMATKLKDDYKNMIDSVGKYGGFYVGRYELSSAGTKKNQASLTNTNWYNLYATCKASSLGASSVETRMIWGCQWDQLCKFISSGENGVSLADSTSYGNYSNSTVEGHGSKQVTGYSESWKAKNIYDIAGNCWEWTQEAWYSNQRVKRGGCYSSNGNNNPVYGRSYNTPTSTDVYQLTSRPTLYIK